MKSNLLPLKLRIKFFAYKYGLYAFIFLMIFAFAFLLDKHIEAIFLFVAYAFVRYKFPTTYHHSNTYCCVFLSILSFWLCIIAVLPLQYSILSTIIVATVFCFILCKIQQHIDLKAENEKLIVASVPKFSIYSCTKEEFVSYCLEHKIRNDRIEYVWDILRSQMSFIELTEKYCVEYETIKHDRWKYKKKLLNPLDNKQRK